ncbi:thiamine pyrophosphate-binding protein [Rhodococcoides yunnanense]|uniref:thiamine pyrophosphate-binding protein n=1 Tax=Rhodococcoides yunnanense TaxID=278209 RepID=UPI000933390F|nr:thiamine pyrophosphate-binding protein [Rhodococcus yunnanensis]
MTEQNTTSFTRVDEDITGAVAVGRVIAGLDQATVYGMPGGYTVHIFDALRDLKADVNVHLVRQESVGSVMAEASGRLTGVPSVVMGQGQWILGNAGIGIMEAHLGASPMLVLLDATDGGPSSHLGPYQASLGGYGAVDLPAAMRAITKETFVANDATQALQMTQLAIKHATSGEPGPVAVIFRRDSLFGRVQVESQPPSYLHGSYGTPRSDVVSPSQIEAAVKTLGSARKPIVLAGNGVRLGHAEAALLSFARTLDIPVVTTPAGKGTFPEDHALALGVIGSFGHNHANRSLGESDVIVAVGTKLGATDLADFHPDLISATRQRLIHIDVEPRNIGWTVPATNAIVGDAELSLVTLGAQAAGFSGGGRTRVEEARARNRSSRAESATGDFSARDAVLIMNELLPAKTVVTCDAGENRLFVLSDYVVKEGGTVLQPNGGGGMGYAIPSATAAAMVRPDSLAVATCGDGGFGMSFHALLTAVELGVDMIVVVFDNRILGWVYHGQRGRVIASEFPSTDYSAIAAAAGCTTYSARTPAEFHTALTEALAITGVRVIVSSVSNEDRYQDVMADLHTVDGYSVPQQ